MNDLSTYLVKKSVILWGGSADCRREHVERLRQSFDASDRKHLYRLKENVGSMTKFLESARRDLPLVPLLPGQRREDLGLDQVNDIWLDWISDGFEAWVVCAEYERLYMKEPASFIQILGDVVTASFIHSQRKPPTPKLRFVFTLASEPAGVRDRVELFVGQDPENVVPVPELFDRCFQIVGPCSAK